MICLSAVRQTQQTASLEGNLPIPAKYVPWRQAAMQNSPRLAVHQTAHITFDIFVRLQEDDSNILQVFLKKNEDILGKLHLI